MLNCHSLYIHVPYCVKKCAYCAFYSCDIKNNDADIYTKALIKRIKSLPEFDLNTVYFGGGTPTVLGAKNLAEILDSVSKATKVSNNAEITLEANPGTVTENDIKSLAFSGFNRLSLGIQSANNDVLRTIGRIHDAETAKKCYEFSSKYFENISVDIMFALPGGGIGETLSLIKELSPKHISAYSLILEENTPLFEKRNILHFPDEEKEECEYYSVCEALSDYEHYEISSFAKPGFRSRHNSVYWSRKPYIGIGPAAHSFYQNKRFSVKSDTKFFIENSDKPFLSDTDFDSAREITREEAEEERIMLGLRLSEGVFLDDNKIKIAERYVKLGFGEIKNSIFSLNSKGFRVSNSIISDLI